MKISNKTKYRIFKTLEFICIIPFFPVLLILLISDTVYNISKIVNDFLWNFELPPWWISFYFQKQADESVKEEREAKRRASVDKLHSRVTKI